MYIIIRPPSQDYSDREFGFKNGTDIIIRLLSPTISVRSNIVFINEADHYPLGQKLSTL